LPSERFVQAAENQGGWKNMSSRRILPTLGVLVFMTVEPAWAEEVQWHHDYNAARQEAKEKNRPIVIDFGTSDCCWCKKLDAVTFRDPTVIAQLNEKFVPIKIDGEKEPELAEALKIQSFPTLVFAAPNGKILGMHEGFVEVERFNQQLRRALAESYAQAKPDGGSEASSGKGSATSSERMRLARQLLATAQDDYQKHQYLCCLERCHALASIYADLPEASEAEELAKKLKDDPKLAREACEELADELGDLYLGLADAALQQNRPQQAASYLDRITHLCPGSKYAQAAQLRLNKLQPNLAEPQGPSTKARAQSP
jgi:thioredoxin-like negative regulator of GroEL